MGISLQMDLHTTLLIFTILTTITHGFNVDTSVPDMWVGEKGTYFSYSLTFIRGRDTQIRLVSSSPKQFDHVLHECTVAHEKCSKKTLRTNSEWNRDIDWMGASLVSTSTESQDTRILACTHRFYVPGLEHEQVNGACLLLDNSFYTRSTLNPCSECQAGSSSHITDDLEILVGAPSYKLSIGGAFSFNKSRMDRPIIYYKTDDFESGQAGDSVNIGRLVNNRTTYVVGVTNLQGKVYLYLPGITNKPQVVLSGKQQFSRFGFQTAIGDFNMDGYEDLVVSAPYEYADDHHGAIYLFENSPKGLHSGMEGRRMTGKTYSSCSKSQTCHESRFGFALANVGDLDLDGYPDLAVGAPFEGQGAVYIFRGSKKSLSQKYTQRIEASDIDPSLSNSSFGYSITKESIDVDANAYPDFVVGSYHNDKAFLLRTRPVVKMLVQLQANVSVLDPKNMYCGRQHCYLLDICLHPAVQTIDGSTKKFKIKYSLRIKNPSSLNRASFHPSKQQTEANHTIEVRADNSNMEDFKRGRLSGKCAYPHKQLVYIMENNRDLLNAIITTMNVELVDVPKPHKSNTRDRLVSLDNYLVLDQSVQNTTFENKVHFQSKCGDDNFCQSDLVVEVSETRKSIKASESLSIELKVMNLGEEAHLTHLTLSLPTNIFFTNVSKSSIPISCIVKNDVSDDVTDVLTCDIANPMLSKQAVLFTLNFDLRKVTTDQTTANFTFRVNTTSKEMNADDNVLSVVYNIQTEADLLLTGQSVPLSLFYSKQSAESLLTNIKHFQELQKNPHTHNTHHSQFLGPRLQHVIEVKNIGKGIFPPSKVQVDWPHTLGNFPLLYFVSSEPISATGASCDYDKQLNNPYGLIDTRTRDELHPTSIIGNTSVNKTMKHQKQKRSTDFLSQVKSYFLVESTTKSPMALMSDNEILASAYQLGCSNSLVKCTKVHCKVGELKAGESAVIVFKSIFWNSTFQQTISNEKRIVLNVASRLILDAATKQTNTTNDNFQIRTLILQEELGKREIPWWLLVVAMVAGFLLLLLFILLLWRCGFFRRSTYDKDQKYSVKLTTKDEMETQALTKHKK